MLSDIIGTDPSNLLATRHHRPIHASHQGTHHLREHFRAFLKYMCKRPSFLLPNLMVLEWDPYFHIPHIPITSIQKLLSPTLVSLTANLAEADGEALLSFFDNYPLLCRNLKSVEFAFAGRSVTETTIQSLSRAICNQKVLENVVLHAPIDHIAFRHLSMSPTLEALNVKLPKTSNPPTRPFLPTDPLFCSAEKLEFNTSELDLVTSLLRLRGQVFHTLHLCLYRRSRVPSERTRSDGATTSVRNDEDTMVLVYG